MKSNRLIVFLLSLIVLAGCAPTFPIHALKKGEWGGSVSGSYGHTASVNGSLGYGLTNEATVYATTSNLLNYRLGLYYALTHTKRFIPEIGVNGFGGIGGYMWIYDSDISTNGYLPTLEGVFYGGIGIHSIWDVDSEGTQLYIVINSYHQPKVQKDIEYVGYAFRPSIGGVFPISANNMLVQIDIQTPFISNELPNGYRSFREHFAVGVGLVF